MSLVWLVIGALAVFRVTHLLQAEDGPWDVALRLRRVAGAGFFGTLLDCFYCLSLWIALPVAWVLAEGWKERILLWPVLSAGAIVIQRLTDRRDSAVALYHEDSPKDGEDEQLLRSETTDGRNEPAGEPHDDGKP